jgi:type VI secretion system protein VasL
VPTDTKNSTAANVDKPIVVENPAEDLKYLGSVFFATGSAKLTTATQKALRAIASKIKSSSARQVLSLGNADNRGNVSRNRELSKARAEAVIGFLRKFNREPDYVLRWYGTSRPVAKGNSASDLAKNRRVEIWQS